MPHLAARILTGAALTIALLPAVPAAAAAATGTDLRLTLTHPASDTSSTRTVTLTCEPPGGTHPRAVRACADLARSGGRFVREAPHTVCTLEHRPVVAEAAGRWRGRPVRWTGSFPNACVLRARGGAIFRF
ncbi:SSI family serine proteinase inhibitor [Thermomonospora cellulosilytica]|uniref:Subtilisin inhibitor domain-containing protein n=1 Tax=Thermomonospora cellulosilytica TaxID=1411118 RepID=A0A7W3R8K9_9ACTN|nr:SSI family serine proteinase inhibitor [Thermomonospora cellulosilytica]MBA9003420.1 hypothetical protein [Thermomonospora cellulosilytica]